ncbi:MAG TPA: bifunctional homocysteine S-methyltransferase/methylenetetrahydrofolate reductase, partial [Acidobacteriota bacterium]|nr:bifunctional homocysteine S-methyltransferase/methylenetetrahydrofolate reductase [Acidobacteriota bacterium]
EPIGKIAYEEAKEAFQLQVVPLLEGGVDLFVLETFSRLEELEQAILAIRELCDLPIIAQMTITDDGNSPLGDTPETIVKKITPYKVDVMGLNCSVGPQIMLESVKKMGEFTKVPLSTQPNAGFPKLVDGRYIYLCSSDYMSKFSKRFIQAGVRVLGGCCGTTPEHIKAIKTVVRVLQPSKLFVAGTPDKKIAHEKAAKPVPTAEKTPLAKKLAEGKFVISVEIDPPKGVDLHKVIEGALAMQKANVDVINIADGPRASARMSPMAMAMLFKVQLNIETIVHYCCRDRNLLGMQADLIGAHGLGVRNVLMITGDPPKLGDYPSATAVFDVDSVGLTQIANRLNHGLDLAGNPMGQPTALHIGVGANPGALNLEEELKRFFYKVEAGAEYVMTQPVYDIRLFENFMNRIHDVKIPILLGILPLASAKNAEFLHNEVPGMSIPEHIRKRMHSAGNGEEGRAEGIRIAQEALLACHPMVQGAYIMPPFNRYDMALKVVEVLPERSTNQGPDKESVASFTK